MCTSSTGGSTGGRSLGSLGTVGGSVSDFLNQLLGQDELGLPLLGPGVLKLIVGGCNVPSSALSAARTVQGCCNVIKQCQSNPTQAQCVSSAVANISILLCPLADIDLLIGQRCQIPRPSTLNSCEYFSETKSFRLLFSHCLHQ